MEIFLISDLRYINYIWSDLFTSTVIERSTSVINRISSNTAKYSHHISDKYILFCHSTTTPQPVIFFQPPISLTPHTLLPISGDVPLLLSPHPPLTTMLLCPYCSQEFTNLTAHLNRGCQYAKSQPHTKRKHSTKDSSKRSRSNVIRQSKGTNAIEALLTSDTHNAQKNITSDQLSLIPSIRNRANKKRNPDSTSLPTNDYPSSDDESLIDFPDESFDYVANQSTISHEESTNLHEESDEIHNSTNENNIDDEDNSFIEKFIRFIDPDLPDPFDPDSVIEADLDFISSSHQHVGKLPENILAQIDLLRMLSRAGCSLSMFDKIIKWVVHYSLKVPNGNIWTDYKIETRKKFIKTLQKTFDTGKHSPTLKELTFDYDGRSATIPTFSFTTEVMSLLHDPSVMTETNIIRGYDIFTGKCGSWFWNESCSSDPNSYPTPVDPHRKIGDIHTSLLFQQSVKRYCTQPHHMPVPLVFFYDKANLDRKGGLAVAPLIFTIGFFKAALRRKSFLWRILAYVPNLDIGQGRSSSKDANVKQREHHQVLSLAFSEFQSICEKGGLKTTIQGRDVVLKFFIMFVIGDTAGHNDLCLQFQSSAEKPSRSCHCTREMLSMFDSNQCYPKTMRDVVDTRGSRELLRQLSQRYRIENAFYNLPMSDRHRGIFGCTP